MTATATHQDAAADLLDAHPDLTDAIRHAIDAKAPRDGTTPSRVARYAAVRRLIPAGDSSLPWRILEALATLDYISTSGNGCWTRYHRR